MRKKTRRIALISLGLTACVLLALWGVYRASKHVPTFYSQALATDAAVLEQANDEMGSRATALASDVRREGEWNAIFTAQQINGWLAVDLPRLHPGALPEDVSGLRVAVEAGRATVGFRIKSGGLAIVYSVEVEMTISEPNVVAIRFVRARAGGLPLPLSQVLDTVTDAARRLELPLRWAQADGDPVALVTVARDTGAGRDATTLDTLELLAGDADGGEVYIAGTTGPTDARRRGSETQEAE